MFKRSGIIVVLILAIFMVNAIEKRNIIENQGLKVRFDRNVGIETSGSQSVESRLKREAKYKEFIMFGNMRKNGDISDDTSDKKITNENQSVSNNDSFFRGKRSTDNDSIETTTGVPLESTMLSTYEHSTNFPTDSELEKTTDRTTFEINSENFSNESSRASAETTTASVEFFAPRADETENTHTTDTDSETVVPILKELVELQKIQPNSASSEIVTDDSILTNSVELTTTEFSIYKTDDQTESLVPIGSRLESIDGKNSRAISTTDPIDEKYTDIGGSDSSSSSSNEVKIERDTSNGDLSLETTTTITSADGIFVEENVLSDVPTSANPPVIRETASRLPPNDKNFEYNFAVYDDSFVPCILASMSISLNISYDTRHATSVRKEIRIPEEAIVKGSCADEKSYMTVAWMTDSFGENGITFLFVKDGSYFYVDQIKVRLVLNDEEFPNASNVMMTGDSSENLRLFSASIEDGIHVCSSVTEIPCGKRIVALIEDVSLIAYNNKLDVSYRKEEHCANKKNINLAAIIGGVAGLLISAFVVASYLFYRKRANAFRSELP